jgi:hypothetical protein
MASNEKVTWFVQIGIWATVGTVFKMSELKREDKEIMNKAMPVGCEVLTAVAMKGKIFWVVRRS